MQTLQHDKTLNIYRASAGSGKTHLLTGFYIKLLFMPELLPETHSGEMHFSEVLAVTFTNKATAEMKGRIIEELFLLSRCPRKSDYWKEISLDGQKSEQEIKRKAIQLLVQILNEYSSFNISTIDSFFQKIVRSFARELNVPASYEVELDSKRAIEAAVSAFLDKLDPRQDKSLFEWMVRFLDKRSEEGEGWDIRSTLLEMADKVLGSEHYRRHSQHIKQFTSDKKQLSAYELMLQHITRDWRKQLREVGQRGLELMEQYKVETSEVSFGGAGTTSHFAPWANGEEKNPTTSSHFQAIINEPNKFFKKGTPRVGSDLQQQLVELMRTGQELFQGDTYIHYVTASVIQQDLYELGIMAHIDEELRIFCNEHNIMLLSSATELLSKLIGPYDAPFVYEKTGAHLKSYMIDEFQDTSGLQWHNFTPLVSNALSQGYQNLIVGDVKQSIYRWRGSDWGLLDSEINYYETSHHNDNDETLRTNWRSLPAIVEWNNRFFSYVANELDSMAGTSQISRIYKDVCQAIPTKKTRNGSPLGLVQVKHLVPHDEEGQPLAKPDKDAMMEEIRRQLPLQIISLQQQGFEPRDIAILCRRKNECRIMAETLLQYKQEHPECPYPMDIISDEALQLGTRPVVQTIISMMQVLQNPESALKQAIAQCKLAEQSGIRREISSIKDEASGIYHAQQADGQLNGRGSSFINTDPTFLETISTLANRPLYELTEQLIALLPQEVITNEAPFLQAFRDVVLEYCHSQNADLSAFLEWWEISGNTKAITTPDAMNAIQIMTIHKSKGLGMPAVILPYASWEMDINTSHNEIIWCEPKVEPFRQDILLPIRLDKRLADTIFCQDFAEERLRAIIDNLNTAYVAFTRPKEAMIIMVPASGTTGSGLENLINRYCDTLDDASEYCTCGELVLPIEHEEDTMTIGAQKRGNISEIGNHESAAICNQQSVFSNQKPQICNPESVIKNSLPALSILHSPLQQDPTARQRGNCIHRALQEIRSIDECSARIEQLYAKGVIDARIITKPELSHAIAELMDVPEIAAWFSPELQVLNEQAIMNSEGQQIRPDRIVIDPEGIVTVIDYKTGDDHRGYRPQVKRYMMALRQLGFQRVKGFLLFLRDKRVVEVR